mgnify:CR=1 FL=1
MSWESIKANSSVAMVGATKEIDLGSFGKHTVRVVNTSLDNCELQSQTACGYVLEFEDIIVKRKLSSSTKNTGGWPATELYTYLDTIYDALPSALKPYVIKTTVVSGHGSGSSENYVTEDEMFLLSLKELGISYNNDTANSATATLDYYKENTSSSYKIKKYNGTATAYWTRTAASNSENYFRTVLTSGNSNNQYATDTTVGVAPAFRISIGR